MKVEINQKVFVKTPPFRHGGESRIDKGIVTHIGKKYFYLNNKKFPFKNGFHIEGGLEKTDYMPSTVYASMSEIEEEKQHKELSNKVTGYFRNQYGLLPFSIEDLTIIDGIIKKHKPRAD